MPYKDREKRLECQKKSRQKSAEKIKEYSRLYKQTDSGKAAIARGAAKAKAKRDANPENIARAIAREEWKKSKKERKRAASKRCYEAKRARDIANGKITIRVRLTEAEKKEARAVARRNRKARERAAVGKLSKGIRKSLYESQRGKCPVCKSKLILDGAKKCHIDHVVPLSAGGTNTDDNVQLLCFECNVSKGAKHSVDFMQSRGFLL
jgi:5-methylcytosine-specific restriction endonuclease McrA